MLLECDNPCTECATSVVVFTSLKSVKLAHISFGWYRFFSSLPVMIQNLLKGAAVFTNLQTDQVCRSPHFVWLVAGVNFPGWQFPSLAGLVGVLAK